ncbi:MAG: hypothetical protein OXH70_15965 [Acidobacteria bacterium]|nr:hypothetical protein [Acidobacteriota bacterium]
MGRVIVAFLGRLARSGPARPLRLALRRVIGTGAYDRFRLAVWARAKEVVRVDPLHADILPLIEKLDAAGRLRAGAARRLRSAARGIRAEVRREARGA